MSFEKNIEVLLLSADRTNSILAMKSLGNLGIRKIRHLSNGIEAINAMSERPADFLVCDLNVQFISGWLFVKEMKLSEKIHNLPVVLFGKADSPVDQKTLKEYGIVQYLKFPKDTSNLEFVIHSTLSLFNTSGTIEDKYTKAKSALIEEKSEQAVELYSELHSLADKNVRSSHGLAQSYEQNNEEEKAKSIMEHVAASGDDSPSSQVYRIKFLLKDKKAEEAQNLAESLLNSVPNEYYYKEVVSLFLSYQQYKYANSFSKIAIEEKKYELSVFYLCQAKCKYQEEEFDLSLSIIEKSEELFGIDGETLNLKGVCLKKMGDYEGALHNYEEALKLSPEDYRVYFNLAVCSIEMNNIVDAVRYLETSLRINPKFGRAQKKLEEIRSKRNIV